MKTAESKNDRLVNAEGRSGAILGMALIMVLALSLIGWGLLNLGRTNAVEVTRTYNSDKAFWAAEAGIFHARAMLRGSSSFRASPQPLNNANPSYSVGTTIAAVISTNVFVLRSTGTVSGVEGMRIAEETVFAGEVPPAAFSYVLFGGDGDMWLRKNATIDGNVFQNGDVNVIVPYTIMDGSLNVASTNDQTNIPANIPDPVPTFPVFDPGPTGAGYDQMIADAADHGATNATFPLDLDSKTNLFKGSLIITNSIQGPGILAVSGDVRLRETQLSNSVSIVAGGTLILECAPCIAGTNCLIYAQSGITAPTKDVTLGVLNLLTMGNAGPLFMTLSMTGTLYAAGAVDARKNLNVVGSVVAGQGIEVRKDCTVIYTNLWPVPLLPGFKMDPPIVTNILWREIF